MKYLIVLLVVVAVGWWLASRRPKAVARRQQKQQQQQDKPQAMLSCTHCGVHLPASEAVVDGSGSYCSEAHRLAGPR